MTVSTHGLRGPTSSRSLRALGGFALAVIVVAGVGGLAAAGAQRTYAALDLPPYAPPAWLFGPVWTVLYALIAIAGWLTWRAVGWDRALTAYAVQLVLNAAWTPLFFAGDLYGVALAEIVVLLAAVVVTVVLVWRRHRLAGALLVPYALWVAFAAALNAGIVVLN